MTKRTEFERLLGESGRWDRVPAAFFTHFGPAYNAGPAAVARHIEFFRATGMDFLKVQYERTFPPIPEIKRPSDWNRMPVYGLEFYEEPLRLLEGLVNEVGQEALVVQTLYSPFMSAGHTTSDALLRAHLDEDPEAVGVGLERIVQSLLLFVKECVKIGVDGFYMSTQGAEAGGLRRPGIFDRYVKPTDLLLMEEASAACRLSILHVCDYHRPYDSFAGFKDYPGTIVNLPYRRADGSRTTLAGTYSDFGRPVLGGLDKKGIIAGGDPKALEAEVCSVLEDRPARFILGADCTVSGTIPWEQVKLAVDLAHNI
jgi:uroporphyrinogen decarboxylase